MLLGDILIAYGLVGPQEIDKALARQQEMGGRLGENLVALGLLTAEALDNILHQAPAAPVALADTGVPSNELLRLLIKATLAGSLETPMKYLQYSNCLPLLSTNCWRRLASGGGWKFLAPLAVACWRSSVIALPKRDGCMPRKHSSRLPLPSTRRRG